MIGNLATGAAAMTSSRSVLFRGKPWRSWFSNLYLVALLVYGTWIISGLIFYSFVDDWTMATSFFFALQVGLSVGYCAPVRLYNYLCTL